METLLKATMRLSEVRLEYRNGTPCFVSSRSVARGTMARPQARTESRTPSIGRQSGETPSGEHAEDGEWCMAAMLRTASFRL